VGFHPKQCHTSVQNGLAFRQQVEQVMRDVPCHIQCDNGVTKAGKVFNQRGFVEFTCDPGGQTEQSHRDDNGSRKSNTEGDGIAGRAGYVLQPFQHGLPDFEHGHILDEYDTHDDRRKEGFFKFRLADEPQFLGGRAHGQLNGVIRAALDAFRAQHTIGAGGHGLGEFIQRARHGLIRAFVTGGDGTGGAYLWSSTQAQHAIAGIIAGKTAQKTDITTEGAPFVKGARDDHACGEGQHQHAGAKRIFHHAKDVVTPGNEDEKRIDDPNAIFLQEARRGFVVTDKILNKVIDLGERADGAPETSEKKENDRDERPPQHPGESRSEVIMCRFGSQNEFKHDDHKDHQGGPLDNAGIPAAAQETVDPLVAEEIAAI